jgi:hypothetical protein
MHRDFVVQCHKEAEVVDQRPRERGSNTMCGKGKAVTARRMLGQRGTVAGVIVAALALSLLTAQLGETATVVVVSPLDSGPGSLRRAIASAQPGDTIIFTFEGTIALTSGALALRALRALPLRLPDERWKRQLRRKAHGLVHFARVMVGTADDQGERVEVQGCESRHAVV